MYCSIDSAYDGFRSIQLSETDHVEPHVELLGPPMAPVAPVERAHVAAPADNSGDYSFPELSSRRLLTLLLGLVVVLLFVLVVLVIQLSHAQTALLRRMAWH